ncbi:MAG: cbb3-type cytochrome c oxidase subunit I [Bacteriovoracaceae bacterium]
MNSYTHSPNGIWSWLFTTDHKKIALLYLASVTIFFIIASGAAALMRIELFTAYGGDIVSADNYNRLFTIHGILMIFFFLVPVIPNVFGNFLLPIMLGAHDVAYPRLNLATWYIFIIGGIITLWAILKGGVDTGWTFYAPYSTFFSRSEVLLTGAGVFISGVSSILAGINFIATIHKERHPDMGIFKLPLFAWAIYAASIIQVLGTPVLGTALILIWLERFFSVGIFDPTLGGDPLLFQHLFWFYSHPAVYIMILPAMGVISEIIPCFTRRRIFGYKFIAAASLLIAVYGFLVWGHHMFVSGESSYSNFIFSFLSFLVAVPSAIKTFSWIGSLYRGKIYLKTPMLYALAFVFLFVIGGLTGIYVASLAFDVHVHDTYFIVAHFHYIMVGGTVTAFLGAMHFWWPKLTGKTYNENLGRFSALIIFLGFNLTFFPQFILGYMGMPRRYYAYDEHFEFLNQLSTYGLILLGIGYFFPMVYLGRSLFKGKPSGDNPWNATGLEWATSSPPPEENFIRPIDSVPEAYDYSLLPDMETK